MTNKTKALKKYSQHVESYDQIAEDPKLRPMAIERLALERGNIVLDVGCGTGLSFALIEEVIGPEGRIIGIDQSPDMLAKARQRAEQNGWRNVTLIQAAVQEAAIPLHADAAIFNFTHDIMRTRDAVANVVQHLKPHGRVVVAGIKWAPWWRILANVDTFLKAQKYLTTLEGLSAPWSHLVPLLSDLKVESLSSIDFFRDDSLYLATGIK